MNAIKRAIQLADKFDSKLILEYIFEKQVLEKLNNVTSGAVTTHSLEEMQKKIKAVGVQDESHVLFDRIEDLAQKKNIEICKIAHEGVHTDEILGCIEDHDINLMITEFHKDTLLKYRILYDSPVHIWLEQSGKKVKNIYGIITNLSLNKLVPNIAVKISEKLNVPLHFYYVNDTTDPSDEPLDEKERTQLFSKIKKNCKSNGLECKIDQVSGDISTFLNHQFRHDDTGLVILGRFKKPAKFPFINSDKKIEVVKKLKANVLILK